MAAYEQALQKLHQAGPESFLDERKRLAAELRAAGDAAAATLLAKRRKPTASVWAVNQLYWHARAAFDELIAAADRLRGGELRARASYREATSDLRKRAATILKDAGHASNDAILRRVTTTLAAIAATGGFEPDPPGALAADRDPPGFEAIGVATPGESHDEDHVRPPAPHDARGGRSQKAEDAAATRARAAAEAEAERKRDAERKRRDAERARRKAERARLHTDLRTAKVRLRTHESALAALEQQLRTAEEQVRDQRATVSDLERKLAELDSTPD